jgi:hypothetical protein
MPSNRITPVLGTVLVSALLAACMTREAAREEPSCCDAATPDASADAADDASDRDRAPKLPPPTRSPLGAACVGGTDCASGFCADGVCCASACDTTCYACNQAGQLGACAALDGMEDLSASSACTGNRVCASDASGSSTCKLKEGEACLSSDECAGGVCRGYYPDGDRDGYGAAGSPPAFSRCDAIPKAPAGFSVTANDCCDSDPSANPSAVTFSTSRDRCRSYDWNCNGVEDRQNTQGCASAGGQPVGCGASCSIVFKGTVSTIYVQACR